MTKTNNPTMMRRNDSDPKIKKVRESPPLKEKAVLASAAKEQCDLVTKVVSVLLRQNDLLQWRDAMAIGSTCRNAHKVWIETREAYLLPVLNVLEAIVGES